VESFHNLPLSQADLPAITSDKEQLYDNDSIISISQLVHMHDIITSEPYACAEYIVFIPITS
jgi:hypothetical protein